MVKWTPFKDGICRYTQFLINKSLSHSPSFFNPTSKVEHFFMDHINLIRKFLDESNNLREKFCLNILIIP